MRRSSLTIKTAILLVALLGAPVTAPAQVGVVEGIFIWQAIKSLFKQPSTVRQLGTEPQLMPYFSGINPGDPVVLEAGDIQTIVPWFAAGDRDWEWVQWKVVDEFGAMRRFKRDRKQARTQAELLNKEFRKDCPACKSGKKDEVHTCDPVQESWGTEVRFAQPGYYFVDGAAKQSGRGALSAPASAKILVLSPKSYDLYLKEKERRLLAGTWNPYGDKGLTPDELETPPIRSDSNGGSDLGKPNGKQPITSEMHTPPATPKLYLQNVWDEQGNEVYKRAIDEGIRAGKVEMTFRRLLIKATVGSTTEYVHYVVARDGKLLGETRSRKAKDFSLDLALPAKPGTYVIGVAAVDKDGIESQATRIEVTIK
jgi:hypothetical protein